MSDPAHIFAWQRLNARITTSGKLLDPDIASLAEIGVKHVVNLALDNHPEALVGEGAKLAAAGIGYTHIPVPFDAPDEAHYQAFKATLAEHDDAPIHVHCIMNWRVSAFFYRLNLEQGMAETEARSLMDTQWNPITNDSPHAQKWAEYIQGERYKATIEVGG